MLEKNKRNTFIQLKKNKCSTEQLENQQYLQDLTQLEKNSIRKYVNLYHKATNYEQPFSIESLFCFWDKFHSNTYECIQVAQNWFFKHEQNLKEISNIDIIWYNYAVFLFKMKYYNSSITFIKKSHILEAKKLEKMIKMVTNVGNKQTIKQPSEDIQLDNISLIQGIMDIIQGNDLNFCLKLIRKNNSKKIPIKIIYNIALLLKKYSKFNAALEIFQSILNISQETKLNIMITINIAEMQSQLKKYYKSLLTYNSILANFKLNEQCQKIVFKRLKQLKAKIQSNKVQNQILKAKLKSKPLNQITNQLSELSRLSAKQLKLQQIQRLFRDSICFLNVKIKKDQNSDAFPTTTNRMNSTAATIYNQNAKKIKTARSTLKIKPNSFNQKLSKDIKITKFLQKKTVKLQGQNTIQVKNQDDDKNNNIQQKSELKIEKQLNLKQTIVNFPIPIIQSNNLLCVQNHQLFIPSTNSITLSSNPQIYDKQFSQILQDYDQNLALIKKSINNKNYQFALQQIQSQLKKTGVPHSHKVACLQLKIQFYQQLQQYHKVIELYNELIYSLNADNPKNYAKLAEIHLKNKDQKTAIKTFLIAASKGYVQAYERIAQLFYERQQYYQAIRYYEKKLAKVEDNDCKIKLSHLYGKVPHFHTKGIQILKLILEQDPHNQLAAITLGNIFEKQKQFSKCIEVYQNFRINNMMSININYLLGLIYKETNNQSKSFQAFVQALRLNPVHIPSLIEISRYIYPNSIVQSFRLLKSALHVQPNNLEIMRLLYKLLNSSKNIQSPKKKLIPKAKITLKQELRQIGDCFYKNQFVSEAQIVYKYIVKEYDTWQQLQKIADICTIKGDYKQAEKIYLKLKKRYPIDKAQVFYKLAKVKYITQNYNQAIELANDSFELKQNKATLELIALCYEATNQLEKAKAFYKVITIKYQDDLQLMKRIKARLAFCQNVLGDYNHEKQTYLSLVQADEYNFSALHNLAHIFLAQGDYQNYFLYIQQLLELYPNQIRLRKKLIKVAMQENQFDKANFHLQKCHELYRKDREIINLQRQLEQKYADYLLQSSARKQKRKKTRFVIPKISAYQLDDFVECTD